MARKKTKEELERERMQMRVTPKEYVSPLVKKEQEKKATEKRVADTRQKFIVGGEDVGSQEAIRRLQRVTDIDKAKLTPTERQALIQQQEATAIGQVASLLPSIEEQKRQEETLEQPQELEPTLIEKQFEAEGGFQELEGRGERAIEKVAEVGLIPAKVGGDIILSGLEKFTGKKYGRQTTAELAETDFGKLLGITTAAVASATLIGVAGVATAGAVGAVTGKLAVSLGVSKGIVAGAGLLGVGAVTGLNTDVIIDKILDRKETSEIISAITTIGATSGAIEGTYMAGGYGNNPGKAIAELQQLNNDLLIAEHQIQQAVILDERVKQSGELINIMADLQEQKLDIVERTTLILQAIPEYNPTQILEQIEIFKDIRDDNRQSLIDREIIREVIL